LRGGKSRAGRDHERDGDSRDVAVVEVRVTLLLRVVELFRCGVVEMSRIPPLLRVVELSRLGVVWVWGDPDPPVEG